MENYSLKLINSSWCPNKLFVFFTVSHFHYFNLTSTCIENLTLSSLATWLGLIPGDGNLSVFLTWYATDVTPRPPTRPTRPPVDPCTLIDCLSNQYCLQGRCVDYTCAINNGRCRADQVCEEAASGCQPGDDDCYRYPQCKDPPYGKKTLHYKNHSTANAVKPAYGLIVWT